ncbi:hypothetical protein BGX34_003461 [Mortierella sp. NVP85]|nr:hypothetical protein BGX34_003461 [Mortierella sp. NVP85]
MSDLITETQPAAESPLPIVSDSVSTDDDKAASSRQIQELTPLLQPASVFFLGGDGRVQFEEDGSQAEFSGASQARVESVGSNNEPEDSRSRIRADGEEVLLGMTQECQYLLLQRMRRAANSFKLQKTVATTDDERIDRLLEAPPQLATDLELENNLGLLLQRKCLCLLRGQVKECAEILRLAFLLLNKAPPLAP